MKPTKSIAIVGYGYVGRAYHRMFPDAVIYDIDRREDSPSDLVTGDEGRSKVNACDLAIVCVPTPEGPDGVCDVSAVEDVVSWITTPLILIKSTVPPGTTRRLAQKYEKHICFSPEYVGESKYWTPAWKYPEPTNPLSHGWVTVGGERADASAVVDIFKTKMGPDARYALTDSTTAEMAKYMENCFFATKVAFCNQFYDLAVRLNVDYNELRELWLLDPRINRMHTVVFPEQRGYGGKCYPKDMAALVAFADAQGYEMGILKAVIDYNKKINGAA